MVSLKNIKSLYISKRWLLLMSGCSLLFLIAFFIPVLLEAAIASTLAVFLSTIVDFTLLYSGNGSVRGTRIMSQRFSLGDNNPVVLSLANLYPFQAGVTIYEQFPEQFQLRDFIIQTKIRTLERKTEKYSLKPLQRGNYLFGTLICYVRTPLGLLKRRFDTAEETVIKVYPSFLQLKKYHLLASTDSVFSGIRKIRRLGHSMEFEKIKNYVPGDDLRTINWKATARAGTMMVNTYTDAREQQIYALIDKGRTMKMSFEGMTLLDHAINASLCLLNVALLKHDRAGLISFSNQTGHLIPAEKRPGQIQRIAEALYRQETDFKESDYESLLATIHNKISQRSFLLLFTNFETLSALDRQLPYLKKLSAKHLLCVVFFENTLLKEIREKESKTLEDVYIQTIAERFSFEKKLIAKELQKNGILALLTKPQDLTIDIINQYLELKARQMI